MSLGHAYSRCFREMLPVNDVRTFSQSMTFRHAYSRCSLDARAGCPCTTPSTCRPRVAPPADAPGCSWWWRWWRCSTSCRAPPPSWRAPATARSFSAAKYVTNTVNSGRKQVVCVRCWAALETNVTLHNSYSTFASSRFPRRKWSAATLLSISGGMSASTVSVRILMAVW